MRALLLCVALSCATAPAVQLMSPARVEQYRALMPRVDDAAVDALLTGSDTLWYDAESIVPGYQDSMGSPKGFRPNTIAPILIDLAVPGGHKRLFDKIGRFNFPFATGGADRSDNMVKINFWAPPKVNGQVLPVAYWKLNFTHYSWVFPAGTRLGEVLMVKHTDGALRVFEIRVRTRELDKWTNTAFRPFPTALSLADAIRRRRMDWHEVPALKKLMQHLSDDTTLTRATLSAKAFKGTFTPVEGVLDVLPEFGDPALVKDLLRHTQFQSTTQPWKASGGKSTFAASTASRDSIVPVHYDAGLLPVDDVSCRRCHSDAGRGIGEFHGDLVAYGELWGEDETFSWHPFENKMFVNAKGEVQNFNNDNRRIRQDFTQAGLVKPMRPTEFSSYYKALPREWKFHPIR